MAPEGITIRHKRSCASRRDGKCNCRPTYQAQVYSARERRRISRTFSDLGAARTWRQDAQVGLRRGTFAIGRSVSLQKAADEWLEGAKAGIVRNRSGDPYKPSTLRGYRQALKGRLLPLVGPVKLADLRRADVQRLVQRLQREGLDASTIRNVLMPLRAIYRQAIALDEVALNPVSGVQLPAVRGRRDRFASPTEATKLLAALPRPDRTIWATAIYTGLRRAELLALGVEDVDLATGLVSVHNSWDVKEAGLVGLKSRAARRRVPIPAVLRDELDEHIMGLAFKHGFIFGRAAGEPFESSGLRQRADTLWRRAKLRRITLHECRHTYASLMIAAGVNAKALSTFMGHASITITLDRYGHLMPGSEDEAADLLDEYLERADDEARKAAVSP
jgi:integrase